MSIDSNSEELESAKVYYYSATEPTEAGNNWPYVEGHQQFL